MSATAHTEEAHSHCVQAHNMRVVVETYTISGQLVFLKALLHSTSLVIPTATQIQQVMTCYSYLVQLIILWIILTYRPELAQFTEGSHAPHEMQL